jgi:polyvinyl alcohol dehydrogenase (cytochrome)
MGSRRVPAALALLGLFVSGVVAGAPARAASCAPAAEGGDWPLYGHDLANTRTQPLEDTIGTGNVGSLTKKWTFAAVDDLGGGAVTSTPVVADGCVFVTSSVTQAGEIFALNADDGSLVWSQKFGGDGLTLVGGALVGSPAVADGKVVALISNPNHPYVVALDEFTGALVWGGQVDGLIDDTPSAFINASPIIIPSPEGAMVFAGFSGYEADDGSRGGWSIFDLATGARIAHEYSIDDAEYATGAWGASLWATAAADAENGYVYAPTGNPASRKPESRNSDSILKIDVRRSSPTFGQILAAYHGNYESYIEGLNRQPACDNADVKYLSWGATCPQLDLDFGASPNLFRDASGHLMVGAQQKSGVYHVADASTMGAVWSTVMGLPGFAFNAASTAYSGSAIFGVGTPGGVLEAMSPVDGRLQWASPVLDGLHYQSVTVANGVVYAVDGNGFLNGWDAATGLPLLKQPMASDTGNNNEANQGSSGVAVARHRLFTAVNSAVIAYGL